MIFVFGSNEAGIHGAGAASYAMRHHSARLGVGFGPSGRSWAIPTKDWAIEPLDLMTVQVYVKSFLRYAEKNPDLQFQITQIGCGLAGFDKSQIAPMFVGAPENCLFDTAWKEILGPDYHYWGTF